MWANMAPTCSSRAISTRFPRRTCHRTMIRVAGPILNTKHRGKHVQCSFELQLAAGAGQEDVWRTGSPFSAAYTWSKFLNDMDVSPFNGAGRNSNFQNFHDPASNYGPSNFDIRQSLKSSIVYQLPFGMGRTWLNNNRLLDDGHWWLAGFGDRHQPDRQSVYRSPITGRTTPTRRPALVSERSAPGTEHAEEHQ